MARGAGRKTCYATELDDIVSGFCARVHAHRLAHPDFAEDVVDNPALLPHSASQLPAAKPQLQRRLSALHFEISHSAFLGTLSESVRAHVVSLAQYGAGAGYDAVPSCRDL